MAVILSQSPEQISPVIGYRFAFNQSLT